MRRSKERREDMLQAIAAGESDVRILSERFGVSESTVRRDLQRLSRKKAIMRTYGGAMIATSGFEDNFSEREKVNLAAKRSIALCAREEIQDGETIILDGGSTVAALARVLTGRKLTVVTNNLMLVPIFADSPDVRLVILGGEVRTISMSTSGSLAENALKWLTATRYFTSADGIVAGLGLCEATFDQIAIKRSMANRSCYRYVLADASKLGNAGQNVWMELDPSWTLITDGSGKDIAPFTNEGLKVLSSHYP